MYVYNDSRLPEEGSEAKCRNIVHGLWGFLAELSNKFARVVGCDVCTGKHEPALQISNLKFHRKSALQISNLKMQTAGSSKIWYPYSKMYRNFYRVYEIVGQ